MDKKQLEYGALTKLSGGLYLVSTPIGNLRDISLRALDVLCNATFIACEDTRISGKLMKAYNITTPLIPYHDHSHDKERAKIITRLQSGEVIALISDAGTPLISDPGYKLVQDAIATKIPVIPIPGANAMLPAMQISGLPTDSFMFGGFVPSKSGERRGFFQSYSNIPQTLVFYETAKRLEKSLNDLKDCLGNRAIAVCREITKMYEDALRGTISDVLTQIDQVKGEIVLVIHGAGKETVSKTDLHNLLLTQLDSAPLRTAVDTVVKNTGLSRKLVYKTALSLRDKQLHKTLYQTGQSDA